MDHPMTTSLLITAIGMSLLFLALVFFYGLMSLMMSIVHRRPTAQDASGAVGTSTSDSVVDGVVEKAAAIAVALARAESEVKGAGPVPAPRADLPSTSVPSPWWALHHQRQVTSRSSLRRTR